MTTSQKSTKDSLLSADDHNVSTSRILKVLFAGLWIFSRTIPAAAQEGAKWTRVTEGSISIFTEGEPAQAAALIRSFAQMTNALAQASEFHGAPGANLQVIAFRSEKEFDPYRLNAGSSAFYQQTPRAEYVVLQDMESGHREVTFHEFTHFVIAHSGVTLPLWLNEGLADFYSTFQISGDTVTFGGAVAGRLHILHSNTWLPLNQLLDVSTTSSYYSNPTQMHLFYSESWVLAHMLVAGPNYAERFPFFLRALHDGNSAAESFQLIYNKTLPQVESDLHEYADHGHLPLIQASIRPLPHSSSESSAVAASASEVDIALSDLTLTNPNARAALQNRIATAAGQSPQNAQAEEALGYLALRQGKSDEAREHFRKAVDRQSSDPTVLFYLAHLDRAAGVPAGQVLPLLERAVSLKPDLADAHLELALVATEEGKYSQALESLQKLTQMANAVRPENAFTVAYTEAYCYAYSDKLVEARAAAQRAKGLAASEHDRAEIAELVRYIDEQA